MKKSRTSSAWMAIAFLAGIAVGPVSAPAAAAEVGLMNVARSQELQLEQTWSDSLPARGVTSARALEEASPGALDDDEDVQRYVQMHEDALDSPIKSFLLPWSTLQQIAN